MATMAALRAHERSGPRGLRFERVTVPVPGPGEVLVAVHAAAITFTELDWDETWGHAPAIPSHEFSGVVHELGDGVDRFEVGDEVFGLVPFDRNGAAADYLPIAASQLAARPVTVSHVETAALPLAALTAWQAFFDHVRLSRDDRVLVLGGAGGVGSFAIQIATHVGAAVTTTVRGPAAAAAVQALAPIRVIDVAASGEIDGRFDVVLDTVGGAALDGSFDLLERGGRLVTLQAPPSAERAAEHGIEAVFFIVAPDAEELREIADMVDRGLLRVPITATYPLAAGREAFESGAISPRAIGKTVLVVRD